LINLLPVRSPASPVKRSHATKTLGKSLGKEKMQLGSAAEYKKIKNQPMLWLTRQLGFLK